MVNYFFEGQETQRLSYRKISLADFGLWLPFHQDKRTSEFWSGLPQDPETACKQDLDRTLYRYENHLGGKQAMILKETREFIGLCGLLVQEIDGVKELEIAYSLLPKFWGKGYATEAAQKCKAHAFENQLSKSLISIIHVANVRSQKVAINNGMLLLKTTTYHNNPVHIYSINA